MLPFGLHGESWRSIQTVPKSRRTAGVHGLGQPKHLHVMSVRRLHLAQPRKFHSQRQRLDPETFYRTMKGNVSVLL